MTNTTKLLHKPTGLVGEASPCNQHGCTTIKIDEYDSYLISPHENFKPLSEFSKDDLRLGDLVRTESTCWVITNTDGRSRWDEITKVTRNDEVIWEREEKSEIEQIIDVLEDIEITNDYGAKMLEAIRRLEALEAKRGAE